MRRLAAAAAAAGVVVVGAACGSNRAEEAGMDTIPALTDAADTLRGVIAVTGADPLTRVELRPAAGPAIVISGPLADTLRGAAGLEVRVVGRRDADRFEARAFRVRRLQAMPAADGLLEIEGDAAVLVTPEGERISYPNAPLALRALEGRRVWIAGEPGAEPQQWGRLDR